MKGLATGVLAVISVLPAGSAAQRGAVHGGVSSGTGFLRSSGTARSRGFVRAFPTTNRFGRSFRRFGPSYGYGYWGGGYGLGPWPDYGYLGDYGQESEPNPNAVAMPAPMGWAPMPRPEPPARPVVHDYNYPEGDASAVFSIIAKDGSTRSASAVWVEDGVVHYITPEGVGGRLPLGNIDRQATSRANGEKHLRLWLPAIG
jgi:hypothetical protein